MTKKEQQIFLPLENLQGDWGSPRHMLSPCLPTYDKFSLLQGLLWVSLVIF